ncbi:MAG: TldD/PmbA family protein [Candidatus Thorarchaeota archaeon]
MSTDFVLDIADKVVKSAVKIGADQAEAVLIKGKQLVIRIEESSIVKANNISNTGIGIRVMKDQRVGLASSSQFEKKTLDAMVNDAVTLAKISNPDKDMIGFATKASDYPEINNLYDKELANMKSEELVEHTITILNAALERDKLVNVSGSLNLNILTVGIVNSNGISIAEEGTVINSFVTSKITKDDDIGFGMNYGFSRKLAEFDLEKIGKVATEKAFNQLGGDKITSGNYPVLIDERSSRSTVNSILNQGVSAYNIIQGTAFFSDRLGEEIASPMLTVYDNPLEHGGTNSRKFDDEGTPCQKTTIVEKGTLLSYLSDVYTAHKLDIPNTGSANKQGYEGVPHPQLRLIQIEPGDASKDELFAELGTGLYLENGFNSIYGTNISQQVDQGFWVEKGEIKYPVKNTMLGTTVYDILKNIKLIGKDLLIESGLQSPMILFGEMKVSSGK